MSFTISLIPTSLSLVHIPRTRLEQLSHPIIKQILQANTSFLNITCNELEICIFGESASLLEDFEPIARRDRQRQRSRQGSASSSNGRLGLDRRKASRNNSLSLEPVEISYEKWSVIQVDSHSSGADDSGARVHSVSAPLSAAGISILYQSSYMSDYIFVKEWRIQEAISILTAAGFSMYTDDSNLLFTPAAEIPHSIIGTSYFPTQPTCDDAAHPDESTNDSTATSCTADLRGKSHSPASVGQIRVLSSDLVCVGLDDNIDSWGLKVIKLLAYPDLISGPQSSHHHRSEPKHLRDGSSGSPVDHRSAAVMEDLDAGGDDSSDPSDIDEEGYFSDSPQTDRSASSVYTSASLSSKSQTDVISSTKFPSTSPSKHLLNIVFPMSPIVVPIASAATTRSALRISTDVGDGSQERPEPSYKVPFFSFTRTTEGCSLTTNVRLLAALFPPHERHVIMCSGQLERADDNQGSQEDDEILSEGEEDEGRDSLGPLRDGLDDGDDSLDASTLRCLQIDLSMFGLEKHGLINKFSRVLGENNINHMYSCTLKTANILVDKRNVRYARSLLRSS